MKVNLITDAPKHNLALMKISSYHKAQGDCVWLNGVGKFDLTYGSWLYDFSEKAPCDVEGGPFFASLKKRLPTGNDYSQFLNLGSVFQRIRPDFALFDLNYSIGYTWDYCPRTCGFCVVPEMSHEKKHHSIWDFHDSQFRYICLLNNNTFSDPNWQDTLEEIWDANLTVIDENGYDLRLIDEEKADALRRTRFKGKIHYAWDLMKDETAILKGLNIAPKGMVYVLIGFNTTLEEDVYRVQKIHDAGFDPYIMPYNRTWQEKAFKRFVDSRMYRPYKTILDAMKDYNNGMLLKGFIEYADSAPPSS